MLQSLDRYETPCKFCVFSQKGGKTQIGCLANKLESQNYFYAHDEDEEFYVVEGICTTYRPNTWNGGVPDIEKANLEVNFKATILSDYNTDDFMNPWYFGKVNDYVKENTKILIFAENTLSQQKKMDILKRANKLRDFKWEVNIVFINEDYDSLEFGYEVLKNINTPIFIRVYKKDDEGIETIIENFREIFRTKEKKVILQGTDSIGVMTFVFSGFYKYGDKDSKGFWDSFDRLSNL